GLLPGHNTRIIYGLINLLGVLNRTRMHPDHTGDFEKIIMMKHESIERLNEGGNKLKLFCNSTTANKYSSISTFSPKTVERIQLLNPDDSESEIVENVAVKALRAEHKDITGNDSIGLKFLLSDDNGVVRKIGITGDTKTPDKTRLAQIIKGMKDCQIVVAHLGTVSIKNILLNLHPRSEALEAVEKMIRSLEFKSEQEEKILARVLECDNNGKFDHKKFEQILQGRASLQKSEHLQFSGVNMIFNKLFKTKNSAIELGIISEFGEETGSHRHKIAALLNGMLLKGSPCYEEGSRVMTGDIGLFVDLLGGTCEYCKDDCYVRVRCTRCHKFFCPKCIKELSVKYREKHISYDCLNCYQKDFPRVQEFPLPRLQL
ncbi:MAG: hypothetical protein KAV25_04110, partial [Methanophagales archaeon]|nr:hypothetical protein [Methanophagales archaeon]